MLGNASKAMGVEGLNSIYFYGTAQTGNLGQNNNANQPWPMAAQNDYVRAIDFSQPASRATWATYAVPVTGGRATLAQGTPQTQQLITPQTQGWAQQLEIWVTPWGFLKGAAANNATVKAQNVGGRRYQVVTWNSPVKSPGGQAYRVVGYINNQNLVERVQTWVENPIFGDMLVESEYSNYRDNNGLKFPATIVQKRGGWPTFEALRPRRPREPFEPSDADDADPAACGAWWRSWRSSWWSRCGAAGPTSEKLADGVFRINGAYNALAVEFADHIVLFEPGPQNEARAPGDHRRDEEGDPEQADSLRRDLASSLRSHERTPCRRRRRHHHRHAGGEQGVLR